MDTAFPLIVDSTLIVAPSSTKNQKKQRAPDAHQAKEGNEWHLGYKAHIGVDKASRLVHHLQEAATNVHNVAETSVLLTGDEETVYGDSGYLGADNAKMRSSGIPGARKSNTKSIADCLKSESSAQVTNGTKGKQNTQNLQYRQR